jgi:hypothetical protein
MRPIERISIFLKKVDFNKLEIRWDTDISQTLRGLIFSTVRTYWLKNPDQRFGQILINLNLIPYQVKPWNDEEHNILYDQGVEPREFVLWGTYGKDGKQPFKRILLKDMSNEHIQACITNIPNLNPQLKEFFEDELEYRTLYPQFNIIE